MPASPAHAASFQGQPTHVDVNMQVGSSAAAQCVAVGCCNARLWEPDLHAPPMIGTSSFRSVHPVILDECYKYQHTSETHWEPSETHGSYGGSTLATLTKSQSLLPTIILDKSRYRCCWYHGCC
jgi:hypothetical protein